MKKIIATLMLASLVQFSMSAQAPKRKNFAKHNLVKNGDFEASNNLENWTIETVDLGTAKAKGKGYVWLNHNNRAGDPAIKQVLTGLDVGKTYRIFIGWRGGDHGPIHGVTGARNIFAIDLDGKEIKRLTTGPNFTNWMVNDQIVVDGKLPKHKAIKFTATATSHTLRFRGEVGADGDVLIDWIQVKKANNKKPSNAFLVSNPKLLGKHKIECWSIHASRDVNNLYYFSLAGTQGKITKQAVDILIKYRKDNGKDAITFQDAATKKYFTVSANGTTVALQESVSKGAIFYPTAPLNTSSTKAEGWYSFESKLHPGAFLRHQGFVLKVTPNIKPGTALVQQDATFKISK